MHNFIGTLILYRISGTITSGSTRQSGQTGVSGVSVVGSRTLGTQLTDQYGKYSFVDIGYGTQYSLTPTKAGDTFTPAISQGVVRADVIVNAVGVLKDSDNDGLTDLEEGQLGTNPQNSDSDDDGITDGQETIDGTNPTDSGSYLPVLRTTLCSDWNGFLGMDNILEHLNLSNRSLTVSTSLYSLSGSKRDELKFKLGTGREVDILVHDMKRRDADSYGVVCSGYAGSPGDMGGEWCIIDTIRRSGITILR